MTTTSSRLATLIAASNPVFSFTRLTRAFAPASAAACSHWRLELELCAALGGERILRRGFAALSSFLSSSWSSSGQRYGNAW